MTAMSSSNNFASESAQKTIEAIIKSGVASSGSFNAASSRTPRALSDIIFNPKTRGKSANEKKYVIVESPNLLTQHVSSMLTG